MPVETDKFGYGTYAYRNRRVFIKPVWTIQGSKLGYKFGLPGRWDHFGAGKGWYNLDRCLRAAGRYVDKLVSE